MERYLEDDRGRPITRLHGWTIVKYAGKLPVGVARVRYEPFWLCRCECGRQVEVIEIALRRGRSKRCKTCAVSESNRTRHRPYKPQPRRTSISDRPTHVIWKGIVARPKVPLFEPWKQFDSFLRDVGTRPSRRHTLKLLDKAVGYMPGNVRWALKSCLYGINWKRLPWKETVQSLDEWALDYGLKPMTLRRRILVLSKRCVDRGESRSNHMDGIMSAALQSKVVHNRVYANYVQPPPRPVDAAAGLVSRPAPVEVRRCRFADH